MPPAPAQTPAAKAPSSPLAPFKPSRKRDDASRLQAVQAWLCKAIAPEVQLCEELSADRRVESRGG